jgi:peptidoglycan hydrolase-like protein with peptidoglycan-binding domain
MILAGKAAWAGIVFLLLTAGISGPRPTVLASGVNLNKEAPTIAHRNDTKQMQRSLRDKAHYRGEMDGVFGLRTRASIRGFQKTENLPVTGEQELAARIVANRFGAGIPLLIDCDVGPQSSKQLGTPLPPR